MISMKTLSLLFTRIIFLAGFVFFPQAMKAQWAVVDAPGLLQAVENYRAMEKQIKALGSIAGVNDEQLASLNKLVSFVGRSANASQNSQYMTPAQLGDFIRHVPGLENVDVGSMFNTNGALNMFSDIPVGAWNDILSNPNTYYRGMLRNRAISKVGADIGLTGNETQFLEWVNQQDPQYINKARAAQSLGDLMVDRYLDETKKRRERLQALSEQSNKVTEDASKPTNTLTETSAGQTKVIGVQTNVQIETGKQITDGNNAVVLSLNNNTATIEEGNRQAERQRAASQAQIR